MPYAATVYRVMIASPGDVNREREAIREVIYEWNSLHSASRGIVLLPVAWETHAAPLLGDRPQAIINRQILATCDLLVGTFWTRIGTPTGESASGTAEEIQRHLDANKPAMIYFSSAPVTPDRIDPDQYQKLGEFKSWCAAKGLVESYDSHEDFRDKFTRQLTITLSQNEHFAGTSANPQEESESLRRMQVLKLLRKKLHESLDDSEAIANFKEPPSERVDSLCRRVVSLLMPHYPEIASELAGKPTDPRGEDLAILGSIRSAAQQAIDRIDMDSVG